MLTNDVSQCFATLLAELANGAESDGAFVLNAGDKGLLRSLDYSARPRAGTARLRT